MAETSQTSHQAASEQQRLPTVDAAELPALLEALLLVSPESATLRDLATAAGVSTGEVERALATMNDAPDRGWVILRHQDTVQLSTAPRFTEHVRHFLRIDRESRLSGAAVETLTLIAYRQPVTRAEIDALRGVDSSGVLATLHARGLIDIAGRLPTVGNPIQYATTVNFLRQFGLSSLSELPPLGEFSEDARERVFAEAEVLADDSPREESDGSE